MSHEQPPIHRSARKNPTSTQLTKMWRKNCKMVTCAIMWGEIYFKIKNGLMLPRRWCSFFVLSCFIPWVLQTSWSTKNHLDQPGWDKWRRSIESAAAGAMLLKASESLCGRCRNYFLPWRCIWWSQFWLLKLSLGECHIAQLTNNHLCITYTTLYATLLLFMYIDYDMLGLLASMLVMVCMLGLLASMLVSTPGAVALQGS